MKRLVPIVLLTLSTVLGLSAEAMALLDQFQGDSAIYSGSTEYLRPNVLFVVDNSAGMEQAGSREPYDPAVTYSGSYDTSKVYERKTATGGVINYVQYIADVSSVTCTTPYEALTTTGYYAGELKKDGSCATPLSGNYFIGNILNYIESSTDPSAWEAEKAYAEGHFIRRVIGGEDYIFEVTVAGTSASSEPDWPTEDGETVTDGTVTWTVSDSVWAANTSYAVGDIIRKEIDGINYIFQATTAGTSDSSEPTWPTTPGSSVIDNTLTWALPGDIIDMVQDVLKQVVAGARESVNFGLMTFGGNNAGGWVRRPVMKLGLGDADDAGTVAVDDGPTNYSALRTAIDGVSLLGANAQPLNETLHDVSYYFTGNNNSSAKIANDYSPYPSPVEYTCQKNFVIILTTGATDTNNPKTRAFGDLNGDGNEGYIDDLAKSLYESDLDLSTTATERIQTHVIQLLTPEVQRLKDAANASHGRGDYFKVNNASELTEALLNAMANIVLESDTSFVAPVVPTSPENRTYSGQRVYLGFFKPISQRPWHGNLKKYGINTQNQITDANGAIATLDDGSFNASAVSFWGTTTDAGAVEEGGAGEVLLNRNLSSDPRDIYTNNGTSNNLTHSSNAFNSTNMSAADLGVADDAARDLLIDYLNGYDAYDDDGDGTVGSPSNGEKRDWILGDVLHSKPQIINYNSYEFTASNEASCTTNKTMIYVGTNDGMLHAFRDCDGKEEWAYIPDQLVPNLKELAERPALHTYFIDSSPVVYTYDHDHDGNIGPGPETGDGDSDTGSNDKVILLFGLRRGGDAYYALDVTDPTSPQYLWKIDSTTTGFTHLGETWSEPQFGKVKVEVSGVTKEKVVAFVGGGYDIQEDGRYGSTNYFPTVPAQALGDGNVVSSSGINYFGPGGRPTAKGRAIYAIEIATTDADLDSAATGDGIPVVPSSPVKVWGYEPTFTHTWGDARYLLNSSFPSDITVLDTDYNGYIDRLYVGDTGGHMWRFQVGNVDPSQWEGDIIMWTYGDRKIFYRPSVSYEPGGVILVAYGTGDRAHPLNTHAQDRFMVVKDKGQSMYNDTNTGWHPTWPRLAYMEDVTANNLQAASPPSDPTCSVANSQAINCILDRLDSDANLGWYIRLNRLNDASPPTNAGEKVLASPLIFNKVAYFTTYTPNTTVSVDPCSPGNLGVSRLYATDYKTGEAVLNFYSGNDSQATTGNSRARSDDGSVLRGSDREITLGIGIPSGLVVIMPPSGDAKLLIGCGGGLCSEDPVMGGTIIPIYWMQW